MCEGVNRSGIVTGRHGPQKRRVAHDMRQHPTPAEKVLWDRLRAGRLEGLHFRRQQVIDGFVVDFYCHAAGLVVEVDGAVHDETAAYDADRDRILTTRGLRILRFANDLVLHEMEAVLREIRAAARQDVP